MFSKLLATTLLLSTLALAAPAPAPLPVLDTLAKRDCVDDCYRNDCTVFSGGPGDSGWGNFAWCAPSVDS
jgi:hypothetical protein